MRRDGGHALGEEGEVRRDGKDTLEGRCMDQIIREMEETRQDTWQPNEPADFFLEINRLILTV